MDVALHAIWASISTYTTSDAPIGTTTTSTTENTNITTPIPTAPTPAAEGTYTPCFLCGRDGTPDAPTELCDLEENQAVCAGCLERI